MPIKGPRCYDESNEENGGVARRRNRPGGYGFVIGQWEDEINLIGQRYKIKHSQADAAEEPG